MPGPIASQESRTHTGFDGKVYELILLAESETDGLILFLLRIQVVERIQDLFSVVSAVILLCTALVLNKWKPNPQTQKTHWDGGDIKSLILWSINSSRTTSYGANPTNTACAIKNPRASLRLKRTLLKHEARILKWLEGYPAIPKVYGYGRVAFWVLGDWSSWKESRRW